MTGLKEELVWLENKIDFLERSNSNGIHSKEIQMLSRIKNNYSYSSDRLKDLERQNSFRLNPDSGY